MKPHLLLQDVRVLDLSRVLAGPVCCQVLADLGADVVKVERPGQGDDTRQWGPPFLSAETPSTANPTSANNPTSTNSASQPTPSAYYLSANRGKRSIALDLASDEGKQTLAELIRRADVLVENFLPDSLEKLGLTPERLKELNPQLVSVSISGYGRTGPLADTPGYDLVIQATAGIMSITGEPAGMPMKIGVAITDVLTGLYAAISALAGLHARGKKGNHQHGEGTSFDLALADCTLASLVNVAQGSLLTGQVPKRFGNAHPHIVPYEAFAASDGHLVLAVGNDRQFQRFCQAAGRDDLASDARYANNPSRVANRAPLISELTALFKTKTVAEWDAILTAAEVPHAPVKSLTEMLHSPQTAARQMVREVTDDAGRTFSLLASPIHADGAAGEITRLPPALGQHTSEVLADWLGWK